MNGVNLAEAGHSVLALPPQTIAGGATAQAASMKGAEHVSIYILFGAEGGSPPATPTGIQLGQCSDANGDGYTQIVSFRYYYQLLGGAGNDILNGGVQSLSNTPPGVPPNYTNGAGGIRSANGAFPTSVANIVYVIELDAAELEIAPDSVGVGGTTELPYIQIQINNGGGNITYCCVLYVFTGLRYAYKIGASFTV